MQFTLNNQTQGFGIITNSTSQENKYLNTYHSYNNYFIDSRMIIFEENKIFDFLKYSDENIRNSTFNQSIEDYGHELYKRILEPNRNYMYLELCDNPPYKHKFIHFLQ
jgi:hypothetical protein